VAAKLNATACSLLGFLHDRPLTGWELSEVVSMTIGNFWNVTRSQVYRELKTLEAEGHVIGGERGVRDKRAYEITESGRAAFADWIRQEPGPEMTRYPLLVTVWFGDHLPEDELEWFLRLHRARHEKQERFLRNVLDTVQDHSTPAARATRFGLYYEQAVLRWFDSMPCFGGVEVRQGSPEEPRPSRPARPGDFPNANVGDHEPAPTASRPRAPEAKPAATAKKPATKPRPPRRSGPRRQRS